MISALAYATLAAAISNAAQPSAAAWTSSCKGMEHLRLADLDAELFRFDLNEFEVDVVVPGRAHRETAAELRERRHAALAINGGFFDTDARPLGLRVSGKRVVIPLRPHVDWGVLVVRDGAATIVHSREYVADRRDVAAIQVGPRLLIDGRPTNLKPQSARRTAVALDKSGRFLTVVATRRNVEAAALAGALARLGFDRALMLDGGPSTQLSNGAVEITGAYPVPDGLVIWPRPRLRTCPGTDRLDSFPGSPVRGL